MLRYSVQQQAKMFPFPFGTLAVNIGGCFLIGLLWAYATKGQLTEMTRLLLITVFLLASGCQGKPVGHPSRDAKGPDVHTRRDLDLSAEQEAYLAEVQSYYGGAVPNS